MDVISRIEAFPLRIPRDTPYLGPLEKDWQPDARGVYVRPGNRTFYSIHDHTVLIRLTTRAGLTGWGESFGVIAPEIVTAIVESLGEPLVIGRSPHEVTAIYDDLYDSQRVRGHFGGFWLDAVAGIDMALWDLRGKMLDLPVCQLLGGVRAARLPVYASGLPAPSLHERTEMARSFLNRGFTAVKFAGVAAGQGELEEMAALRATLGPGPRILADLHWKFTAPEAVSLITAMEPHDLAAAEAPVASEDVDGLRHVARSVKTPVAGGEELRTVHEYMPRLRRGCMSIVQPEMLHTGITGFQRICHLADAFHCRVMPHATVGIGIGQAASLHVSATLRNFAMHEYQHSIFDRNLKLVKTDMRCAAGHFHLPLGPGLGAEPTDEALGYVCRSS